MFDDPLDDVLSDQELALVTEMRDRQSDQRRLRTQLLTDLGERVEVHCRLHLLEPDAEVMLSERLRDLDDRLAIIRHTDAIDRGALTAAHEEALRERAALAARLEDVVSDIAVAIGRPPRGGEDWSLSDVPTTALEDIAAAWAAMRRDLVRLVDLLVESDLVRAVGRAEPLIDVVLREHDAESIARVQAFATEVLRLDDLAQLCTERVRRMALRAAHAHPRGWLAQNRLRSRQAREALDMVRAVQAARAELEIFSRSD
jgi:hypothetical protein